MDINVFHLKFLNIISKLDVVGLCFYQFGSSLNKNVFNDIDIVIVYDNYIKMEAVKLRLINDLEDWLPHVICLTVKEEFELSFVSNVGGKKIFPID